MSSSSLRPLSINARLAIATFIPIGLALITSFSMFTRSVEEDVRQGLGQTLGDAQRAQARLRRQSDAQRLQMVAALAESPVLKAGLTLWRDSDRSDPARLTVEDQLREIGTGLKADWIAVADANGNPVAGLTKSPDGALDPIPAPTIPRQPARIIHIAGDLFDTTVVPVNTDSENLGLLYVGRRFDPSDFHTQALLLHDGSAVRQVGTRGIADVEEAIGHCANSQAPDAICPLKIDGQPYLALRADADLGPGYAVWTLHSVDQATSRIFGSARRGLGAALVGLLIAALLAEIFGARAVTRPLIQLVNGLRESEASGVLKGEFPENSSTREVNQLAHAFNLAARSVADSQRRLDEAYLQITQTMAQTLDARDPYTAGHSARVSAYAVSIAEAMNLAAREVDTIRVGANFHDIGKIGIPDSVLQKADPLSTEEFEIIKQHPTIGKRILEGVARFRDYLSIVELHHENWNGSGYPWGLAGEKVPLGARIVHVVDAYDAMTTSRPYRRAMPRDKALSILQEFSGSQFDPAVVEVFLRLAQAGLDPSPPPEVTVPVTVSAVPTMSEELNALQRSVAASEPAISVATHPKGASDAADV